MTAPHTNRDTHSRRLVLSAAAALCALTLACYAQVYSFDFIYIDDDVYVIDNPLVHRGFTPENIREVFTSFRGGIWMPLTTLTFIADHSLFGLHPGGYHITNLVFHCMNTLLLFFVIVRMTGAPGPCFFAAALFGVHPLHVESVAWISERKDVLSVFFFMLCLLTYVSYVRKRRFGFYLLCAFLFIAGLMAKPMLVTFPAVLLLLDWWPLGRFADNTERASMVLAEKLPLFAVSAAAGYIAYRAQQHGESITGLDVLPLVHRCANALTAYGTYLLQTAVPHNMGILYPHPGIDVSFQTAGLSALVLMLASVIAIRVRTASPAVLFGWLWFLGTLVPVIGLVQIGPHARADRFMYIPLIGLAVAVAWGMPRFLSLLPKSKIITRTLAALVLLLFSIITAAQVSLWKNSETLFAHTLQVTEDNFRIHNNLGHVYYRQGHTAGALEHFARAAALNPSYARSRHNLGVVLSEKKQYRDALYHLSAAVRLEPGNARYRTALGGVLFDLKQYKRARLHFGKAVELNPGSLLIKQGSVEEAIALYRSLLKKNPGYAAAHYNLGAALYRLGRIGEAAQAFQEAIRHRPRYGKAYFALGNIRFRQGRLEESIGLLRRALTLMPDHAGTERLLRKAREKIK
jgi:tetratricopeptide (TPR) repeat protein